MKQQISYIGLPQKQHITDLRLTATDYDLAVAKVSNLQIFNQRRGTVGMNEAWLTHQGNKTTEMQTYHQFGNHIGTKSRSVDSSWVGIAPHFYQPDKNQYDLQNIAGKDVLVQDGLPVYYPQTAVNATLAKQLSQLFHSHDRNALPMVGEFTVPYHLDHEQNSLTLQVLPCFRYGQDCFVLHQGDDLRDQWLKVEMVEAVRNANGDLQSKKILFPSAIADINHYLSTQDLNQPGSILSIHEMPLGDYLNFDFANDLSASRYYLAKNQDKQKLAHLKLNFVAYQKHLREAANRDLIIVPDL